MKKDAEEGTNIHAETSDTHLTYRWLRRVGLSGRSPQAASLVARGWLPSPRREARFAQFGAFGATSHASLR